jgi:hypothetical protein
MKESLTVLAPYGQANVIVSTDVIDPRMSTEEFASSQGDQLRAEFPGYEELEVSPHSFAGMPGILRRLRWQPPDGVPVLQLQLYALPEPGRSLTATATTAHAAATLTEPQLLEILDSISIDA